MANTIDLAKYVARVEADTSGLKSGLAKSDNLIKGTLDKMGLATKLSIAAMVTAVGVGIKKSVDSFVEFENQMNSVYTLLPDISESAMAQMEDQVRSLSKEMGVLPNELIPALYSSLSASVPQDNVFEFLEVAQKGAIAGMTSTENTVDALTTVLNSYHKEATEAENVSDILFETIKYGKTSMEELSGSLSQVSPIASNLGVDFEDVGAALATMTSQGASTANSSTQLKQMFSELSKAGSETSNIFKEIAGVGFKEFIAEGHNVNDALSLMEDYANETGVGVNDLFSSVQAGQAALMLTGESADMFSQNIERMGDSAGATEQAYQTMDQSIGRSFEKIKVGMADMLLELGTNLAPMVQSATDYILEAMPTIQNVIETVFQAIGEIIKGFITVIDWLVKNISQFVSDNEEYFTSVFETIKTIFESIIEVVRGFVELFQVLWNKYGEDIMTITETMWNIVSGLFENALNIIKGILDVFIGLVTGDWERMGNGLKSIAENFWNLIKGVFNLALESIKGILRGAITVFTDLAKLIMTGLHDGFKAIWDLVTEWFSEIFESLFEWLGGLKDRFFNIGRSIFDWVWDGMKDIWDSISSWVSDKVSWLADKLAFWRSSKDEMDEPDEPRPRGGGGRNIPRYDVGTPFVPSDGLAFIHKGEAVIPAKYNPYNPVNSGRLEGMAEITENHYHINTVEIRDVREFDDFIRKFTNSVNNLSNVATQRVKRLG